MIPFRSVGKIEQLVQEAIQPHLQTLLDKHVIFEETINQLQDDNTKLRTKTELIDIRMEERKQYSRRTSLPSFSQR
jgi:hypothetical protein